MMLKKIFSKKNEKPQKIDFSPLIGITEILTNNDQKAINYAKNIAQNNKINIDLSDFYFYRFADIEFYEIEENCDFLFCGGDYTPLIYAGYFDWKENISGIIWQLEKTIPNLKYPIDLSEFNYADDDNICMPEALDILNENFKEKGYLAITAPTNGDDYMLFIIPKDKYTRLLELGKKVNITFECKLK